MVKPYIGVTGITKAEQAEALLSLMRPGSKRKLMIGVLASRRTLAGGRSDFAPERYPCLEDITDIFPFHSNALNLVHYNTKTVQFFEELAEVHYLAGPYFDGFQLNICWPSAVEIKRYHDWVDNGNRATGLFMPLPHKTIVLQIGARALQEIESSPAKLVQRLNDYRGLVHSVLIDPSGGQGKMLDVGAAGNYLRAIRNVYPGLALGVAGGLSPSTLPRIRPLVDEFCDLSIDAEGRLRDENDKLHLGVAGLYVKDSINLFANS
ncbi:MAG: hypothetical protein Q7S32_04475 [bacterium]|nr:hypothetical protein [bacterium]